MIHIHIIEGIPYLAGAFILVSVLIAGQGYLLSAWIIGLLGQLLLVTFGLLTGHEGFMMNAYVALAFLVNVVSHLKRCRSHEVPKRIGSMTGNAEGSKDDE